MANTKLENKKFQVPDNLRGELGDEISYSAMKMRLSRGNASDEAIKFIENRLKKERTLIHNTKKIGMDSGRENQFKKPHEKDRKNSNPTGVGGIISHLGKNVHRQIMRGQHRYNENIEDEINTIKYLMEYMDNNKIKNK